MTWTAALDPTSLVGQMLNPEPVRPELMAEAQEFLDDYGDDFKTLAAIERAEQGTPPPTTPEPLPLWRVISDAGTSGPCSQRDILAAEIEALRDWLLPEESDPWLADSPESMNSLAITAMYTERQRLRAALTEQARIARGEP